MFDPKSWDGVLMGEREVQVVLSGRQDLGDLSIIY